ncbi:MAG TPA: amidohydrolase [Thermoanaerobaculia bacterium]|nr:amidohydrolase [Thermoanaerobaculia bacterium]
MRKAASLSAALLLLSAFASAQGVPLKSSALAPLDGLYPDLDKLYLDLHQTPELSLHEEKTSAKMASHLRALGFEATERVGGYGVVGVLKNGKGPTVLLRADMDALPVEEKTGFPYASKVTVKDDSGATVSVMHACGHDIHMTSWVGAATLLSKARDRWRGTLVMIAQPAEEKGGGAVAMLKDGLFTRFPKPDFAIAFHDSATLPAGKISVTSGWACANVDSVDIAVFGRGGHGAYPHATVDPVVIAARIVVALQTLVSRENSPFDPAVVTVGSIHGGTKHNIIPDEVRLQLTVRSYKDDVRKRLLAGIERIAKAEAAAGSAPKEPTVTVSEGTPAMYNDPALARRLSGALTKAFGESNVIEGQPVMGGEDFSEYGRAGVPAVQFEVGAVPLAKYEAAKAGGAPLPSLHSSQFGPDREPTIRAASSALTIAALELLARP